jgi:hypothetical protein
MPVSCPSNSPPPIMRPHGGPSPRRFCTPRAGCGRGRCGDLVSSPYVPASLLQGRGTVDIADCVLGGRIMLDIGRGDATRPARAASGQTIRSCSWDADQPQARRTVAAPLPRRVLHGPHNQTRLRRQFAPETVDRDQLSALRRSHAPYPIRRRRRRVGGLSWPPNRKLACKDVS